MGMIVVRVCVRACVCVKIDRIEFPLKFEFIFTDRVFQCLFKWLPKKNAL